MTHVHIRLLLNHNGSLCARQPVEKMNATLFFYTGYLAGKQSVTLCLLSTAALADTGERPSLLAHTHTTPVPTDTPPPLKPLHVLQSNTQMQS